MSFADRGFGQLREEGEFPSRSVVVGIIAAAMGLERDSKRLLDLHRGLRIHVASLLAGSLLVDYHTVLTAGYDEVDPARLRREGAKGNPTLTWRSYHSDSHFMVSVTSEDENLLSECRRALEEPVYTTFIGRRSCPPATPLLPVESHSKRLDEQFISCYQKWLGYDREDVPQIPWHLRSRLPQHLDIWIDGDEAPEGLRALKHSFRRDMLTALPRSYVNRSVVHVQVSLPPELLSNSNEDFFNATS